MELQTTYERLRKREIQSPALKRPNQPQQSQDSSNNSPSLDQNRKLEHFQLLFPSGSESEEQSKYRYRSTSWVQLRALIYKNASIQAQQKGTNICQVLTPIICLVVVMLVKSLASANFQNTYAFEMEFPYFFNVPYHALYNTTPSPLEFSSCLQFYLYDFENATKKTQDFVLGTGKNGLLNKTIPSIKGSDNFYKCAEYDTVMPYFKKTENGSVNEQIYDNLLYLNNQTFTPRYDTPGLDILPDGAFTFYEANKYNLSVKIQINDLRLPEYHRGNGVSKFYVRELTLNNTQFRQRKIVTRVADGELIMIDLLSKAYIQKINSNVFLLSGSQYMPISTSDSAMLLKAIGIAGASLYPIALSLLLPVFLYTLVLEKEERLREMMKMNGLKIKNYWLVNYFWNLGLYLVSTFVFFLFGRVILRVPFFTDTSATILIPILFGWGLSQVSLSFFYQNFLSKTRTATILGYLLSIWTTIIAMTLNSGIYPTPQVLPTGFKLYPPFAFCRLIYILSLKCGGVGCVHKFSALTQEAIDCIQSLYFGAIVFLIFGLYLDAVLPQQYGVAEHPLFFLPKWLRSSKQAPSAKEPKTQHHHILEERDEDDGDMDVIIENELVKNMQPPLDKHPLIIKNLRKIYKAVGGRPPKVAVKNLSLHIKKGEMFGLLGPNGAGKTSLISMLTGLYPPEAGNAWVGGYNIIDEIEYVHTQMGVCPQFDLLWPNLTVEDHLLFYARIRGVPKREEKRVVEKAMAEVYLTRFTQFKVDQLSGGMKRRLSVAISLVGDPQIVFLDEPTTGLDPENRRRLWDILVEARGNRAIVLTTHSMEEADILCTRIGIITNGGLKCLGPQTRLKSRYGSGYHLSINCHREKFCTQNIENNSLNGSSNQPSQKVQSFMKMFLPKAILKSCFNGNLIYLVPLENLEISKIFQELEKRKPELGISDWGISQSTLEDVFMEVVNSSEEKGVNFKYKL